jgi:hypothetical protein
MTPRSAPSHLVDDLESALDAAAAGLSRRDAPKELLEPASVAGLCA